MSVFGKPYLFRRRDLSVFLPADATQRLIDAANALLPEVNRNEAMAKRFAQIVEGYVDTGRANLPHEERCATCCSNAARADVTGAPWIEIDFPNDVTRAAEQVLPQLRPVVSRVKQMAV